MPYWILKSSTAVSLKAREVLILGEMPSYEERLVQMEAILKASVTSSVYGEQGTTNRTPSTEILRELSDSRYTVYDVLPSFFSHVDPVVTLAAFEVYLLSIDYEEGDGPDDGELPSALTWRFNLGRSHSPPATPSLNAPRQGFVSDLSYLISRNQSQPTRTGNVAALLPIFEPHEFRQRYGSTEPPNVMNLALRIFDKADDVSEDTWAERALKFVKDHNATLVKRGVRRMPILICKRGQYPMYFTLRCTDRSWAEEQAIRNIEPALAFQLELSRLSNYKLRPVFVETKQIRCCPRQPARQPILRPTKEYLISETDRLVTSILDALEVVSAQYRNADVNHIFMNFVYDLQVSYEDVLEAISGFIERHGKRLWRLHVTGSDYTTPEALPVRREQVNDDISIRDLQAGEKLKSKGQLKMEYSIIY
ncbi:acetyl-CoA carboxylase [Boletus edulis]|nr:acetyl-CoA carboxylase [Boletus edulis]